MEETKQASPLPAGDEDLTVEYANSSLIFPNVWDVKLLFGELSAKPGVDWHTSITLPWAQAKIMSFYLGLQIAAYEATNGKIKVPDVVAPKLPPPLTPEQAENPINQSQYDLFVKHVNRFLEEQK